MPRSRNADRVTHKGRDIFSIVHLQRMNNNLGYLSIEEHPSPQRVHADILEYRQNLL